MSSLADLPEELWQMIVLPLEKRDVSAISRCCNKMRERTIPCLYDTIDWTWNSKGVLKRLYNPPVHLLLRSLVENRPLGGYVKHLNFRGSINRRVSHSKRVPGTIWERDEQPYCTADDLKGLRGYVHEVGLPSETLWTTELEMDSINVFVALVLSLSFNVQSVFLSTEFRVSNPFLGLLLKRALFSSALPAGFSTFSRLQQVEFPSVGSDYLPRHDTNSENQVASLFYLPSIRKILAVILPRRTKFTWPGDERPRTLTLDTLDLPCCYIDGVALLHLLSATPNLRRLRYDYVCDIDSPKPAYHGQHYDLAMLGRALRQVRTTLTQLSVSIDFYAATCLDPRSRSEHWAVENRLGGLADFGQLESLEISFAILLGLSQTSRSVEKLDGLLPRSLRELCLNNDLVSWDTYEWSARACLGLLEDFLADRENTAPKLARLVLRFRELSADELEEHELEELRVICRRAGVQCTIDKPPNLW